MDFKASIQNTEYSKIISFTQFERDIQEEMEYFNYHAKESFELPKEISNPDKFNWWYLSHNLDKLFCLYDIDAQQLIVIEGIY